VPDFALVMGNPARRSGWMCRCGVKLTLRDASARCDACGALYEVGGGVLAEA
jgi:UDP-2-acetamido-3-amino-2,3-dideoxy-glucuronate N-acetyltransferase